MGEGTQKWGKSVVETEVTHTRGTPQQTGARARTHMVSKTLLIVLATNFLNVTCQDACRIRSSVDRDLPEGLRAKTATHCLAPLKLIFSSFMALA